MIKKKKSLKVLSPDPSTGTIYNMVRDLVKQLIQQPHCVFLLIEIKEIEQLFKCCPQDFTLRYEQ